MSRKFSIGDRVRVNCPGSTSHGMETTVVSELRRSNGCLEIDGHISHGIWVHTVDIEPSIPENLVAFEPHELIPIYDGNQAASWSECAWQPKSLVRS